MISSGVKLLNAFWSMEFIRFGLVGLSCSLLYIVILFVSNTYFGVGDIWASLLAYVLVLPVNFFAQKMLTFKSVKKARFEILPFLALHFINMIVAAAVVRISNDYFGSILLSGIFVLIIIPIMTYILSKRFVFFSQLQ